MLEGLSSSLDLLGDVEMKELPGRAARQVQAEGARNRREEFERTDARGGIAQIIGNLRLVLIEDRKHRRILHLRRIRPARIR